ncbi:MAG: hypothetical protein ACTSU2_07530 [Promethearchaeota archaeon]
MDLDLETSNFLDKILSGLNFKNDFLLIQDLLLKMPKIDSPINKDSDDGQIDKDNNQFEIFRKLIDKTLK